MTIQTVEPSVAPAEKSVADVLRHAARFLEEFGWCQGVGLAEDGRRCLAGALIAGAGGAMVGEESLYSRAYLAVAEKVPDGCPIGWNDQPGRTAAEVIAVLKETADSL